MDLVELLYRMARIRAVEECIAGRYSEQTMRCPTHLSIGQEAVAAVTGMVLRNEDYAVSTHRGHAHFIGKGGNLKAMIAEIYGKVDGCARGRGGSMHLIDTSSGFMGTTAIVGNSIPIGVGLGLACKLDGGGRVICVFLGDSAVEEGVFYEAANFAAVKKLPVVFICENNLYSVYSPLSVRQPEGRRIFEMVDAMGVPAAEGDGNDAREAYCVIEKAVELVRSGAGPQFVELATYRWREHCGPNYDNDLSYRTEEEFLRWKDRDPITQLSSQLMEEGLVDEKRLLDMKNRIDTEIQEAFAFAESAPFPDPSEAYVDEYFCTETLTESRSATPSQHECSMSFVEAINDGLTEAMNQDNKVICYGLGVDDPKRIFGTTKDLKEKFGGDRVFDMPTAENGMTGVAVGAALGGYRPVMVHQRLDFFLLAMDQLVNSAAKWHYMFGGQVNVPMVIRLIIGRGWGQGPTHSQSLHAWFAHITGLKVVMPATATDAKGLLMSSIFDGNPVVFLEHRWLHAQKGEVPKGDYRVPLGKAQLLREGGDVTIVANSFMTVEAIHAIDHLHEQGVNCELVDLRTVRPLDWETIENSVRKTGRLLVLDIACEFGSIAGEIIAGITERYFDVLKTAPIRICPPAHATPTSPALTKEFYPDAVDIVEAVAKLIGRELESQSLNDQRSWSHDVPGDWFSGPF